MADPDRQRAELPSVLDRLIDEEPGNKLEQGMTVSQVAAALRHAVRRDLEDLLNHRMRPFSVPGGLDELEASSFEYGIPDFSGANLSTEDKRKVYLRKVERIIKQHEPRFSSVKVRAVEHGEVEYRTLHFQIEAVLCLEPVPELVIYDSNVDVMNRSFEVKG